MSVASHAPPAAPVSAAHVRLVPGPCCLCGGDDASPVAVGEDFDGGETRETYLALACRDCGLVYISPHPEPEPEPDATSDDDDDTAALVGRNHGMRWRSTVAIVRRSVSGMPAGSAILWIGAYAATDVQAFRATGAFDGEVAALALGECGVVEERVRAAAALPLADIRLVVLRGALERQVAPGTLLQLASDRMAPGGQILVITPNVDSTCFRLFGGRHWAGYDFPRHRALFGTAQLRALAKTAGLNVVSVTTCAGSDFWVRSLRNFLSDWKAPVVLQRRLASGAWVLPTMLGVVERFCRLAGRGAWLVAEMRRPS